MAKKTAVRRLFKMLPTSVEIMDAIKVDEDDNQKNAKLIVPDYEVAPIAHDTQKIIRTQSDPGESHQPSIAIDADRKFAIEDFEKAVAGVRKVGGDPEEILGEKINDVLAKDAKTIQSRADILSGWQPTT
jgi:hypothetical protein